MKTITTPSYHRFLLATVALFFVATGLLRAGTSGIQDNAGFFSAAAKADAQGNITLAQRTLHKDVDVETLAAMPDEVKKSVNPQDKTAVTRAYEQWTDKRAESLGVNGVYILIVKDPAHLQVAVGNSTQKQAFPLADRDVLVKGMLEKLHVKDYDGALRHGVSYVVTTMKKNAPGTVHSSNVVPVNTAPSNGTWNHANPQPQQQGSGFPWGWIIALLIIFFVIRMIAGLFHMIFRGNSGVNAGGMGTPMGGGYGYGGGGGGGGGFLRSLMGGVLGAAAGSWMYDSFFGSHGSSAYGAPPQDRPDGGGQGGYTDQDTSFSSSGGDFSDSGSSGGGGFDSGSSGGGDFGGGDSGGGGGDSGGGGDF